MVLQHYISYIQFSRYKCLNNSNLQGIISEWPVTESAPQKNCVFQLTLQILIIMPTLKLLLPFLDKHQNSQILVLYSLGKNYQKKKPYSLACLPTYLPYFFQQCQQKHKHFFVWPHIRCIEIIPLQHSNKFHTKLFFILLECLSPIKPYHTEVVKANEFTSINVRSKLMVQSRMDLISLLLEFSRVNKVNNIYEH